MTHRQIRDLGAYLEDELDPQSREDMQRHLAQCGDCADELQALRRTVQLLRDLPKPTPPPDLTQAVMARLRAAEAEPGVAGRIGGWFSRLMPTASWGPPLATVGLGLGVLVMLQFQSSETPLLPEGGLPTATALADLHEVRAPVPPVELRDLRPAADRRPALAESPAHLVQIPKATAFSSVPRALPGLESCLEPVRSPTACARLQAWMLELALTDPPVFERELGRLPAASRGPWLAQLKEFARNSGSAPLLARELRQGRSARLEAQRDEASSQPR